MKYLKAIVLSMLVWSLFGCSAEKSVQTYDDPLIQAIATGADFAADVLLDKNGRAKGDYNMLTGKWVDYEPMWHTGQIIYSLLRAYDVTGDEKYLTAAKRGGDWWVSNEITDNPVLNGMLRAIHMSGVNYIVFATVTDGTAGLFKLYEATGDKKYAEIPTQAGDWMYANMYHAETAMFYDAVDPETGEVQKIDSPFWEDKDVQDINDVARPNNEGSLYYDMYKFTGDEKYKEIFITLCESLIEKQDDYGLWMDYTPNDDRQGTFHPRFNLWYAESLLEGYDLTGDKRYLNAALKTARFYTKFQKENGAFYYKNNVDGTGRKYSLSGSTSAFAGILWIRLKGYGAVTDEFDENIELSKKWLLKTQYPVNHSDKNLAGGFMELKNRASNAKVKVMNRDIGTSFGIRFLADYYDYKHPNK